MSQPDGPRDSHSGDGNAPQRAPVPPERAQSVYGLIREFFIDVLGSLIPGMLFTLVASTLVMASGACFLRAFGPQEEAARTLDVLLRSQIDASRAWLLLVVGYVVGVIFHRQDPKRPDQKSLERILRGSSESDLLRSAVQRIPAIEKKEPDKRLGRVDAATIAASPGAQFPYSHMREYLEARGLRRLANIIPWRGDKGLDHRTKMFLNILKVRLQLAAPDKCGEIVRNEAHVRMMSSVWYAARAVFGVCWLSALVVLTAVVWQSGKLRGGPYPIDVLLYGALASFAAISAVWLQRHVESCFHYQRVREVVYVLETAFGVARSGHPEILEDLPAIDDPIPDPQPPPPAGASTPPGALNDSARA